MKKYTIKRSDKNGNRLGYTWIFRNYKEAAIWRDLWERSCKDIRFEIVEGTPFLNGNTY